MKKILSLIVLSTLFLSIVVPCYAQFIGINTGIPMMTQSRNKIGGLISIGGLTAFKDYGNNQANGNLDYSVGSQTVTVTSARSTSAPASTIDNHGVINLVTTSNTPRFVGGFYTSSGFQSGAGIQVEAASTNLIIRTDGTSSSGGVWSGWNITSNTTVVGTPVATNVLIPELTSIASATSQRVQYTGISGDSSTNLAINATSTGAGTIALGNVVTQSFWMRSKTGNTGVTIQSLINAKNSGGSSLTSFASPNYTLPGTNWVRVSFSATMTDATVDHVSNFIRIEGINNGSTVDLEIYGFQSEINSFASSWVPTKASVLTRPAETVTYTISGNRTAAQESLFFKFIPEYSNTTQGIIAYLSDTDTKRRAVSMGAFNNPVFGPNVTDSSSVVTGGTTTYSPNISLSISCVANTSSPYASLYVNSTLLGSYTTGPYTSPAWGTKFYVGTNNSSGGQINGIIQDMAYYSSALASTQVTAVNKILNSN